MTIPQGPTDPQPLTPPDDGYDAGTFPRILEPRNPHHLALDGSWHRIARGYLAVQLITHGISLLVTIAATVVLAMITGQWWIWLIGGALILIELITIAILPRQARAYGFMLRDDDIVFRRGIMFQRMVAVPYGRMQLVDITHGPLDRAFKIAQLKMVTAAATTGATLPGLGQQAAEQLRDTLVEVAESRRTGL